jgi:hypothetical protein
MTMEPIRLVAMRLIAMRKVHPEQVTMDCALCGEKVGVYPSGQKVLRLAVGPAEVICHVCAAKTYDPEQDTDEPAGSVDEIVQEVLDSRPVKRA